MTTVSTVLALGMMPLNVWLYSRSWTDETLVIPYVNILISLAMTVVPAVVGIFIRWKWEKIALYIVKVNMGKLLQCTPFIALSLRSIKKDCAISKLYNIVFIKGQFYKRNYRKITIYGHCSVIPL